MKKFWILVSILCLLFSADVFAAQKFSRFSKNAIGPLNVIGVALSEDAASAKKVIDEIIKGQMKGEMNFDIYLDPTYKQLKAEKAVDISFFGSSASGKKYEANADTTLNLKANPSSIIILDRKKKVRGFSQALFSDWDELGKLTEELLLNIDGQEIISVDSKAPQNEGLSTWQTDLGKENSSQKKGKTITFDFGASKMYWYSFLGQEIPNFKINKLNDNTETSLHDAINGKVTVLIVFIAPANPSALKALPGAASMIAVADGFYRAFTLMEAKPGRKEVPNAMPDAPVAR
jgi:hypothetical protein